MRAAGLAKAEARPGKSEARFSEDLASGMLAS
jgi:hypothetical protein